LFEHLVEPRVDEEELLDAVSALAAAALRP
jgi:hypothetical protein